MEKWNRKKERLVKETDEEKKSIDISIFNEGAEEKHFNQQLDLNNLYHANTNRSSSQLAWSIVI